MQHRLEVPSFFQKDRAFLETKSVIFWSFFNKVDRFYPSETSLVMLYEHDMRHPGCAAGLQRRLQWWKQLATLILFELLGERGWLVSFNNGGSIYLSIYLPTYLSIYLSISTIIYYIYINASKCFEACFSRVSLPWAKNNTKLSQDSSWHWSTNILTRFQFSCTSIFL